MFLLCERVDLTDRYLHPTKNEYTYLYEKIERIVNEYGLYVPYIMFCPSKRKSSCNVLELYIEQEKSNIKIFHCDEDLGKVNSQFEYYVDYSENFQRISNDKNTNIDKIDFLELSNKIIDIIQNDELLSEQMFHKHQFAVELRYLEYWLKYYLCMNVNFKLLDWIKESATDYRLLFGGAIDYPTTFYLDTDFQLAEAKSNGFTKKIQDRYYELAYKYNNVNNLDIKKWFKLNFRSREEEGFNLMHHI